MVNCDVSPCEIGPPSTGGTSSNHAGFSWPPCVRPSFWKAPSHTNPVWADEIEAAMRGDPSPRPPLRTYKKMGEGGMLMEVARYLDKPGTVMMQYDGRSGGGTRPAITKNFECLPLSEMLSREARIHAGERDRPEQWALPVDRDFSPCHRYYNIEGDRAVRLFVDFDEPRGDTELLDKVRRDPTVFWSAVADFALRLRTVVPGFTGEWIAVFRSLGSKLMAPGVFRLSPLWHRRGLLLLI